MKNKQLTGNCGLFYVCYKLSQNGWNTQPTARNAKGIDIVAYLDKNKSIGSQVKTFMHKEAVCLSESLDEIVGDFWIIVNNVYEEPKVYILTIQQVKDLAHKDKNGKTYWLEAKDYTNKKYEENWSCLNSIYEEPKFVQESKGVMCSGGAHATGQCAGGLGPEATNAEACSGGSGVNPK